MPKQSFSSPIPRSLVFILYLAYEIFRNLSFFIYSPTLSNSRTVPFSAKTSFSLQREQGIPNTIELNQESKPKVSGFSRTMTMRLW